jgi:succinate dehydrogenase / fumarate reductase cytochrome b subunit
MATLVTTITETLRYRGKLGQWSWAFHRLSGLGVLLFLVLHIIDTSWAAFYPELYADAIKEYQSPLFTLGEFALVAAVVYHAINGLRIVYFDYRPQLWHLQQRAATIVFVVVGVILLPVFVLMAGHVVEFYDGDPNITPIGDILPWFPSQPR